VALAELNGVSASDGGSPQQPTVGHMYSGESMEAESVIDTDDDPIDFWLQLCLTFAAVSASVFVLFLPKVRQLIEPLIGTGYVALTIRSLVIGIISLLPRLLLM